MLFRPKPKRIYLDHAAATPVRKEVVASMAPYWSLDFGNAGAIHTEGVHARTVIETQREKLARVLHVRSEGIVYTASGTESNNLAILGTLRSLYKKGKRYEDMEVLTTLIEHPSVLEVLSEVSTWGVKVTYMPVREDGIIDAGELEHLVSAQTVLVTFAYVNSEIGVVQPVGRIVRVIRQAEKEHNTRMYVHVDAAQAPLWLPCELDALGVDVLTLDAGKCYGPKGVGVLAFRHGVALSAFQFGGAQESGLRPGTENTALIVGATLSLCIAQEGYIDRAQRVQKLRDTMIDLLLSIEGVVLNGSQQHRVANNINISIPGIDTEFAVIALDTKGVACATKSACGGALGDGSSVVRAITQDEKRALSTIRFTLGEATTQKEIEAAVLHLRIHVEKMRSFLTSL